jgi:hypothetical protein
MGETTPKFVAFSLALIQFPAFSQTNAVEPGCGDPSASFSVEADHVSNSPVQPDAGKALVYIIEHDSNVASFPKPTTRAGIDGEWIGTTHANSYPSFPFDPGVRHLCRSLQKSVSLGRGRQIAALHFTAFAAGIRIA